MEPSLSKKSYRGNGYAGKTTVYNDVFGGPPKFGATTLSPRLEDYTEIFESFHASRGSSIPILDLPPVDDAAADLCLDVRSSRFDYSEVFGGFDGVDFAVSYEELFGRPNSGGDGDSSDEAWTPAQIESLSDESDPSASSERNPSLLNGDLDQTLGGMKQLKVSHNKASTKTEEDMPNGTAHVTHLHAVPRFTAFVDKTQPSRKIEDEKLPFQEGSDLNPNMDFGGRDTQEKRLKKSMSQPSNTEFGRERYVSSLNPLAGNENPCSDGTRPHLSVLDISLKTQPSHLPPPSRPPPALTLNKKDSGRPNSKLKASKSCAFERMGGDTSPTYFDVEIDASSSAAVSAAAMKDAVEKAQAKLRSAKESMERKKEGLQSRLKLSDNDLNDRVEKVSKIYDKTSSVENERMLGDYGGEDSKMRHQAREARRKLKKTIHVIEGSVEAQNCLPVTENSVERKHGKEHKSSHGSHRTEENVAPREEAQFYEMGGENRVKDAKGLKEKTKSGEHKQNSRSTVEVFEQQEDSRNINDVTGACGWEEKQNQAGALNSACQWDENKERLMIPEKYPQKEHLEKANLGPQACEFKEQGKKLRGNQHLEEIEKILKEADESEECENLIEIQLKEDKLGFEVNLNGAARRLDSEKRFKYANEKEEDQMGPTQTFDCEYLIGLEEAVQQADNERQLKKSEEQDAKERQQKEGSERDEKEKIQKEDHEKRETARGVKQHHQLEENEKLFDKDFELEESQKRSKMILKPEENMQKLVLEIQENEKRVQETRKLERNQNKVEEAIRQEENARKQKIASERVENENIVNYARENDENETIHKKAWNLEESKKSLQKGLKGGKSKKVAFKEEGNEKKLEARVGEETENIVQDAGDLENLREQNKVLEKVVREVYECRLNSDEDIGVGTEGKNSKGSDGAYVVDDIEIPQASQVSEHDRDSDKLETTQEALPCEEDRNFGTDLRDCEKEVVAADVLEELIEKTKIKAEEVMKSSHLHDSETISNDSGMDSGKSNIENDKGASEMVSELDNANILAHNRADGEKNTKEVQCTAGHEGSKDEFTCPQSQEGRDGEKNKDAPPAVFEGKRNTNISAAKGTSQSMGEKDKNCRNTFTPEVIEKEEKLKRERELENDRLRKIEEERERQREREKDLMSIDRATLEAREKAFVEARERAERSSVDRAAAEVRQRALAEARERLEKACAEARERSFAGKAPMERSFVEKSSMEARLRAERAAVERAAAQARERAEKAAADKAVLENRERAERSVADKLSAASRSSGMRQNSSSSELLDSFQSMGSYSGSRYSHISAHGGGETESPQRCKARLERHRRTAERAAKALAEKNMRDLLVQREQVERNRLAEGLDAEVKRWSSGKEGNLRALLSTLQYILGSDSGWQPVPLTDVITTVAVKKAYRKATLCVHPDKLQQRGATIHQKYVCEKVFDLLKEAWNKFNSEER